MSNKDHGDLTKKGLERRSRVMGVVDEHIEELTQTQIDNAMGVKLAKGIPIVDPKTGDITQVTGRIYINKPDQKAGEYLLNQAIGKPKDLIELSGEVKGIVELVKDLDNEAETDT